MLSWLMPLCWELNISVTSFCPPSPALRLYNCIVVILGGILGCLYSWFFKFLVSVVLGLRFWFLVNCDFSLRLFAVADPDFCGRGVQIATLVTTLCCHNTLFAVSLKYARPSRIAIIWHHQRKYFTHYE